MWGVSSALWLVACTGIPPHSALDSSEPGFSARMAQAHLEALDSIGPRLPGSPQDQTARSYLDREFQLAGAAVRTAHEAAERHLIFEIPGRSQDVVLFVAAYPELGSIPGLDDSGVALLLELARVFGRSPPPYTLRFALVAVRPESTREAASREDSAEDGPLGGSPESVRNRLVEAGRSLAMQIEQEEHGFDRLRAVIVFETTARPGMRFDRDLRSHPVFREIFWASAESLRGADEMFARDAGWSSPTGLQQGFGERGMDRVLALVDARAMRPVPDPKPAAGPSSPEGIDLLGTVTIEAVNRLMRRFEKIDAFSN
jgi:hypothetical protein